MLVSLYVINISQFNSQVLCLLSLRIRAWLLKTFAKNDNLSYACALSNKECINSYKKSKEKPVAVINQPVKNDWLNFPSKMKQIFNQQQTKTGKKNKNNISELLKVFSTAKPQIKNLNGVKTTISK